jgi:hypothetical protein
MEKMLTGSTKMYLKCPLNGNWLHVDLRAALLQESIQGDLTTAKGLVATAEMNLVQPE